MSVGLRRLAHDRLRSLGNKSPQITGMSMFFWFFTMVLGHAVVELAEDAKSGLAVFALVSETNAAPIILPPDAREVVRIAARDLSKDIASITGKTPDLLTMPPQDPNHPRVQLRISPDLAGKWEAFRISAKPGVLVIEGSDPRGLAFGIYELSRRIGVSPWHWWADVPVRKRPELHLTTGVGPVDAPAVRYRGIFINDEDWGLEPWASKTYEPEVKGIGPKTYARVFELLLRLRGNCIWPGMHPTTTPFHLQPGNAAMADRYAIVLGSSHAEPMLRNNVNEWKLPEKDFNFLTHRDEVLSYWEQRVKERKSGESLFTIGMRGVHDSPILGPKSEPERVATLERIFRDQRDLLGKHLGRGDASKVGQIFCPYKEVLATYDAGLKVPEDVSIVWPDDNFGYIRRFATPSERGRSGGLGVYYHASYSGLPFSWLWIDVMPPALIWSEMMRAYEHHAKGVWILNVGDIKNCERSMEFFLSLAWNADRTDTGTPARFLRDFAAREFGENHAEAVAGILGRLHAINAARRAEHLQWHLTMTPYQPTGFNEAEIESRLDACAALQRDGDLLEKQLPPETRDAWFQLVGYPVAVTAAANERYFRSELARAAVARGRSPDADLAVAAGARKRLTEATLRYNRDIAGGKWRHVVTENGVTPGSWPRFQRDAKVVPPPPAPDNVCPQAPAAASSDRIPEAARPGDFFERDGVVSILAGHFSGRKDASSGAGWRGIPGLGRSGCAVTVLPSTTVVKQEAAPSLDYRIHTVSEVAPTLRIRLLPTFPIEGESLRLAVSIDGNTPLPLAVTEGFDTRTSKSELSAWQKRVLSNSTEIVAKLTQTLSPGPHTFRLIAVDPGVVVDKIVIDLGGWKPSYDGPGETRKP